ncbi:hypothetical protein [Actinomadura atramentaria]|uniref:hypothetical protein n=1 Tax=Actinomadura atramentaria TaxID=1990 RepID=UPI00037E9927|nr:hypothetical protein [Actinomadura atramentaria]
MRVWRGSVVRNAGRAGVVGVLVVVYIVMAIGMSVVLGPRPSEPVGDPVVARAAAPDPLAPFAGSPAARWPDGEFGLVTPRPRAMAGFTEEEVSLAYWHVRKMLSAANLDKRALYRRDPRALAALLTPAQRAGLLARRSDRSVWVTSFAPGAAEAAVPSVKVRGTITAEPAVDRGRTVVRVKARHVFVYAVRPPGRRGSVARVVVRRDTTLLIVRSGPAVAVELRSTAVGAAGVRCGSKDGLLRPVFDGAGGGAAASGAPVDPYDLSTDPARGARDECGTATRT